MFDVGILYPSFTNSNLDVCGENGDREHIQPQITIQIPGYNVKKWAHYIMLNADFALKDRSISLCTDCRRIWKKRAVVAVERLKRCYILQPLETCQHSDLQPPPPQCLSLLLSHSCFDFALGPFPLSALLLCFSSHPRCVFIQRFYPCSCLSVCSPVCVCESVWSNLLHSGPFPPLLLPCLFWGCQIEPVRYFRYVLAHVSLCPNNPFPIFGCFLYLPVSFICLLPSCCPSP